MKPKIIRCYYNDDGCLIEGSLVIYGFSRTFYPALPDAGFHEQKITLKNRKNIIRMEKGDPNYVD